MRVSDADGVLDLPLVEAAKLVERREVTSVQVTAASISRARESQASINAFIRIDEDEAMESAASADKEISAGRYRGALHGIPLAHKDMFYRAGGISSCGSSIRQDFRADYTSNLIKRLDRAGAVCVGWLNMSEFAGGPTGHNEHYGDCRNPWNPDRVSGGSSSGSGAAVAARIVFGALGSDTGGSARIPAACCGVVGVKASFGLVSRHGAMRRSWSLDHIGPLARTIPDAVEILQAIAGINANDPTSWIESVPNYQDALSSFQRGLRVGIPEKYFFEDASDDVLRAFENAMAVLVGLGCVLVDIKLPDPSLLSRLNDIISKSEAATVHRKWLIECPEKYGEHFRSRIESGFAIPATRYLEALSVRKALTESFVDEMLSQCDVVCTPTLPFGAPTRAESNPMEPVRVLDLVRKMTYRTRLFNYLGLPALSVPMGFDACNMPLGLQMVGPPLSEGRLFSIAHRYQIETGWQNVSPSGHE